MVPRRLIALLFIVVLFACALVRADTIVIHFHQGPGGSRTRGNLSWYLSLYIDGEHYADCDFYNAGDPASGGWLYPITLGDGSHTVQIRAHNPNPTGYECATSNTITIDVGAPATSSDFLTLPPNATLPNATDCSTLAHAQHFPENGSSLGYQYNVPPASIPSYYYTYAPSATSGELPHSDFANVNGNFTGTTDSIAAWVSCKWGIDIDMIRAQMTNESGHWNQRIMGDFNNPCGPHKGLPTTDVTPGGQFTAIQNLGTSGTVECPSGSGVYVPNQYTSFSIIQEKAWYRWMTWPMLYNSTSFAMDDRYAEMRGCINGHQLGYFHSQSPASAADYSQAVQYATINPNGVMTHSHTKAILHSGETNLEYLAWGCLDTHYCGDWGMVAGCDRYAAEAYQHFINHDWPGGLYRTGRSPQLSRNRPATR